MTPHESVAKDRYENSRIGRSGLVPSLSTYAARSTPAAVIPKIQAKAAPTVDARKVAPDQSVKSNAQSEAYSKAMDKAYKATKVFK